MTIDFDVLASRLVEYGPLASTFVVSIATVVLVGLTGKYVRLTSRLLEESRKLREPSLVVDFELPDNALRLAVENRGQSPALNIKFSVEKDVDWLGHGSAKGGLSDIEAVKNGISYLSPSRKLLYHLVYMLPRKLEADQAQIRFLVTYESEIGAQYDQVVDFDFRQVQNVLFESFRDPSIMVANAIKDAESSRKSGERMKRPFAYMSPQKACHACKKLIDAGATKCPHCYEFQSSEKDEPGDRRDT